MSPTTDDLREPILVRLVDLLRAALGLPARGLDGAERVAEVIVARLCALE